MSAARWIAVVFVLLGLQACQVVPTGQARLGWIPARLEGDIALDASSGGRNLSTIRADVRDDLGLDDSGSIAAGVDLQLPIGRISASYMRYSEEGTGTLTRSFGDIPAGTSVATDVDVDNVKAFWSFDLLDTGIVRVSPGVGVDYFSIDTTVRSISALSAFERIAVDVPMPMLFLEGEVSFGPFSAEAEAGWMSLDLGDVQGTLIDIDTRLVWHAVGPLDVFGGYRWIEVDSDGNADGQRYDVDVVLRGFYFGGGVSF
jgi:hypothetical protein